MIGLSHIQQILAEFRLHASIDPVLQKRQEAKSLVKLLGDPARSKNGQLPHNDKSWWNDLSYDEQLSYLKAHKRSKFKITKHHESNDPIEVSGKDSTAKNRVHQNSFDATKKNIESTRFEPGLGDKLIAIMSVDGKDVQLDIDDWKKAVKHKLRYDKDSRSGKVSLKGELYDWREIDGKVDENDKFRSLAGSLFTGGLKNPRVEYRDGNSNNLQKSNVLVKTYEAGVEDQIKILGAKDVEFRRQQFDRNGITIEAPSFVAHAKIDGDDVLLGGGFADAKTAMLAQDIFNATRADIDDKGLNLAALNLKRRPTKEEINLINREDLHLINNIAKYGTPERAVARLEELKNHKYEDRDIGEDELRSLATQMLDMSSDVKWDRVSTIISPVLPDDISRSDLDDNGISLLDLSGIAADARDGLFDMVREGKASSPDENPMDEIMAEVDSVQKDPVTVPKERFDGESDDDYLGRVTTNLYKNDLNNINMPLKERYDWFVKNKEVFENYELYMNMMNKLKVLGDHMFKEDKGGTRGSKRKAIHIPVMMYPPGMDPQDTSKHIYIFKKHKFRDQGASNGAEHYWKFPGGEGKPTIDHHAGGYAPATGMSFGPQAGFQNAKPDSGFKEKKHYDMLRKIGYSDLMDEIWDEYDRRKRLGIDTMETVDVEKVASSDDTSTTELITVT